MEEIRQELIKLLRKCEGVAYVRVSDIEEIDIPIRMHNEEEFARLKEHIKIEGVMFPLILIKKKEGNGFILVDGRNRLRAAKELGLEEVPALIYSYERYDDEQKIEEARYFALAFEQTRRHLAKGELEEVIKNYHFCKKKAFSTRDESCRETLNSLKSYLLQKKEIDQEVTGTTKAMDKSDQKLLELKETYEEEIKKKTEEIEELNQKIREYEERMQKLTEEYEEKMRALREESEALAYEEGILSKEDIKYFSSESYELTEEERERLIKETEERTRQEYLVHLKQYEQMMKDLKENLAKKENEIRLLNEKIKLILRQNDDVKKVLGEMVGLNALSKRIELLLEEAKGISHLIFELVTTKLSHTDEEWQAVYEKWKEVKAYLDYIDEQMEDALVLCTESAKEFSALKEDEQYQRYKKLRKLEEIQQSKKKAFF